LYLGNSLSSFKNVFPAPAMTAPLFSPQHFSAMQLTLNICGEPAALNFKTSGSIILNS
jgi:hypothetical protein